MDNKASPDLDPMPSRPRLVAARIAAIEQLTPTVKGLTLELARGPYRFWPGQWVDLYLDVGGRIEIGGYSITSSPLRRGSLELAVRQAHRHPASCYLHQRARIGEQVVVSEGQGEFFYHPQMGASLALIAGGIGITPLMSMLRYIYEAQPRTQVALFYSIRSANEFLFGRELQAMAQTLSEMHLYVTATRATAGSWAGPVGRIDTDVLRRAHLDPRALYFLCGPRAMVEDLCAALKTLGVDRERIRTESWSA